MTRRLFALVALLGAAAALAQYQPADKGQRPQGGGLKVLPDTFLRGYDPVTVYFSSDVVGPEATGDDGEKYLKLTPGWPGAYTWVDRRTLQFRPAEPWPALARFQVDAQGTRKILTTMMSPPQAMAPSPGSEGLRPFRVVTLTFPQALPAASLKKMIALELRDLPGLADSPRQKVSDFTLAPLPRASHRDPATWALTLKDDVPEGKLLLVSVSLALGSEGTTLWSGRVATRTAFTLNAVRCGNTEQPLAAGTSVPKDLALACGNRGDQPQLSLSASVANLTLTQLHQLVRLEPAVADLHFATYGSRVQLQGKFVPDTLYKLSLSPAAIEDDSGRPLKPVPPTELYFHLGWRASFLRFTQGTAMLEARGPRMLPLQGYGEPRADVRIFRVDPLHPGLWPFPASPVFVDDQAAPPFPGEEPALPATPGEVDASSLTRHLKLLGSPLVSKVVELPSGQRANPARFGLDLKPLLDPVVGASRPGTYLVGLRRLTGRGERAWMRVQVTNLAVTSAEERDKAVLFVRTLDTAEPVRGAVLTLEGLLVRPESPPAGWQPQTRVQLTSDDAGRIVLPARTGWQRFTRITVAKDDDVLVFSPDQAPPRFADNHWYSGDRWLSWLLNESAPPPRNDATLGFVFTERPIYKPGEKVFLKAFVRSKKSGELQLPPRLESYGLQVESEDGQSWLPKVTRTALGGLAAEFEESNAPSGQYTARLFEGDPQHVVATRSFRIEAYRVPTFEVQVVAPGKARLDAPIKVKAVARYFAGGNVANAPVKWTVTQRPYAWQPKGLPGFLFASSSQFARPQAQRPQGATSQDGELDDSGASELPLNPQLDLDGSARVYHLEATVTGPDEQQVTSTAEVKALPPFALGLKLPRYLEKAQSLSPEVVAVGIDDAPLAGQDITVKLIKRTWHSTLRETAFATGQPKYVTEQQDVPVAEKSWSSQAKPSGPVFELKDAGVYVVELSARDKLGRVQTLSADLYVGGPAPVAWQKSRDGVFELKPDQAKYLPGQTAHVVVQSPWASARALVILEEPRGNVYQWKDVSGGKAVIDVPLDAHHVPNLPLHVVLMRGRLGEGQSDDSRYRPATVAASVDLELEPASHRVTVAVKHPEQARPGTVQDFVISLSDDKQRPVGGEVTFWLVDEAVLSLAPEGSLDPLTALIRANARTTSLHDTRNLVIGRLSELDEEPGGDGSDEEQNGGKKIIRKNFQTVPYYQATLVVPASGTLKVPVKLSDDLTNFRVRAVAVSGATRFGVKQSTLKVRLPVLVQPQLPRFVRVGDRFWPGALARLVEGSDGPGTVEVALSGPVDAAPKTEGVALKANQALSVQTQALVKAIDGEGVLTVRGSVVRSADKASDAFEVKLPVLPDRSVEKVLAVKTLPVGKTTLDPFPEAARPGTARQTFNFTNEPGLLELATSLDYLAAYPHGCLEQKMSQLAPDLALASVLKKLELETRFTPQLPRNVAHLVEELATHQDDLGFLSYWPGTGGDIGVTAQGVEFLALVKKAGLPVDEKVRTRALEALKRSLRSDFRGGLGAYRVDEQAAALRALSRAGELDEHYLLELFARRKDFGPSALADLALAMNERPQVFSSNLASLQSELWDSVVFKLVKGAKVYDGLRRERTSWTGEYLGSSTASTAQALEALVRLSPTDERLPLVRDGLLARSVGPRGFGSTYEHRRAVAALGAYLERSRVSQPQVHVTVPGAAEVALDESKKAARRTVAGADPLSLTVSGAPVSARVAYSFLPQAPGDQVTPRKSGLLVSRSLTWLHPDGSAPTHHDDQPGATLTLAPGDVVEVHAQLTLDAPRNHVALVVPFAAGFEPLNPNLANASSDARPSQADSTAPTYAQRLDQEVRYYFTSLGAGTHSFHFRLRATSEGSFVHPAPYAELMYQEDVRGRGAGMRIVVEGAKQKAKGK
ncbi:MAG: hypothetical protein K1X89_04860 [Myxococcaceae bacterium]|nr:hypothetical protein [Myxococcaceae bacterium]